MRKILIIGSGGAGKSTFARRLSKIINIEVVHLDTLYWKPGWAKTPDVEWRKTVEALIERDSWIMDGNYSNTLDVRFKACDTMILLDLPTRVCLWRVLKRMVEYRNRKRPDLAEGCYEKFDLEFLLWVWNYRKRTKPKILKLIEENCHGKRVIRLRSTTEVKRYLSDLSLRNLSV
ncbi:MAG: DNA topology modulation protein [Blastocatellia bacterium]|nr:DNA topology modulation protein [Blastocatellia bacterium]